MSLVAAEKDRRVVPRWRDFRTTLDTGELNGALTVPKAIDDGGFFADKKRAWDEAPSVETAAELVSSAVVLGRRAEALDAARLLLARDSDAATAVRAMARRLLGDSPRPHDLDAEHTHDSRAQGAELYLHARALRAQLVETPRNAFLWVDLARVYATLGQTVQAVRAMDRALKLVPSNRFVLRSASRLFVHLAEPTRADDILLRERDVARADPWVLAAEIAAATVAGRSSPFVKTARQMLNSAKHPPSHTAELASAVATLDLVAGRARDARRLFRQSLADPNDNAIAQATWAARQLSGVEVSAELLHGVRRSFEARAFKDFYTGQWDGALRHAQKWGGDEPFSSRPALLESYVALVAMNDYQLAEAVVDRALKANPDNRILLNNMVVALANQNRLGDAENVFRRITRPSGAREEVVLSATEGLLRFRRGDRQGGRLLYLDSIDKADDPEMRALAALHLAREEMLAGSPEADEMFVAAEAMAAGVERADVRWMLQSLRSARESKRRLSHGH